MDMVPLLLWSPRICFIILHSGLLHSCETCRCILYKKVGWTSTTMRLDKHSRLFYKALIGKLPSYFTALLNWCSGPCSTRSNDWLWLQMPQKNKLLVVMLWCCGSRYGCSGRRAIICQSEGWWFDPFFFFFFYITSCSAFNSINSRTYLFLYNLFKILHALFTRYWVLTLPCNLIFVLCFVSNRPNTNKWGPTLNYFRV